MLRFRFRSFAPAILTLSTAGSLYLGRLIAAPKVRMPLPKLQPEGGLSYECRDADADDLMPCKLTLIGKEGTPNPKFTRNDIGREEGEAVVCYNKIMSITGVGVARVPVGTYDVYVSRGPEWDLAIAHVKLDVNGTEVRAGLHHVVDSAGWISADFHVHASKSPDSKVPMRDRVYEFVSDGVDMIVSTDHNTIADYGPYIAEANAGKYLTSAIGDEITTAGWGHFGAFPLSLDTDGAGQGAVHVRGRNARDFFADVRKMWPDALIDVHHPRLDAEIGYFNLGKLDSKSDEAARPGFSFDFDALEVLNGYQDPERRSVDRVINDWFLLLNHGHIVTATGNSDTHHLNFNIGGYPRNYVKVKDDHPDAVRPLEVARAVKGHHSFFTTAPFIQLKVDNGIIGDTVPCPGKTAHAEITVQAAPWVSVSKVRLYLSGELVKEWEVPPSQNPKRFHETFEVPITRDSWIVARVDGDKTLAPVAGDGKRFDVYPLAVTNPVFLDVDGNGTCDPPIKHGAHAQ